VEDFQMDHQTFDRLTRLVGTAASRRTAWRALLGGALLGATTRSAAAQLCSNGKHTCGESKECCPGKCFTDEVCEVCCTDTNIICHTKGGSVCCLNQGRDPCAVCNKPVSRDRCQSGIVGSYRRR
jgi:hypothetical protein